MIYGLRNGRIVSMRLIVDGKLMEVSRLEFVGMLGVNDWLHFVNTKTKENHLVKPGQYPEHVWRMGECVCELKYEQ